LIRWALGLSGGHPAGEATQGNSQGNSCKMSICISLSLHVICLVGNYSVVRCNIHSAVRCTRRSLQCVVHTVQLTTQTWSWCFVSKVSNWSGVLPLQTGQQRPSTCPTQPHDVSFGQSTAWQNDRPSRHWQVSQVSDVHVSPSA